MTNRHTHKFVNNYDESHIAFGISRETDETSLIAFMQKFTDDDLMQLLAKRMTDSEITSLVDSVTMLLRKHLTEKEYHRYFLKEAG